MNTPLLPEGVPLDAWSAIGAKADGDAWLTPEHDGAGEIIGWSIRRADGTKSFKPGGHRGLTLTWPLATYAGATAGDPLLIVEGATCTAAGMGLGFDVVGRPSCFGGVEHLLLIVKDRHICIVAENDEKPATNGKPGHWPGRDGANRVAGALVSVCASVRIIFPPKKFKDLRAWIIGGATRADLERTIRVATPIGPAPDGPSAAAMPDLGGAELTCQVVGTHGRVVLTVRHPDGATYTDKIDATSATSRTRFADATCAACPTIKREAIDRELGRIAAEVSASAPLPSRGTRDAGAPTRDDLLRSRDNIGLTALLTKTPEDVKQRAEEMLAAPDLIDLILADIEAIGVVGERELAATCYMQGVSRLLEKPLAVIVQGVTGTGKTHVPLKVAGLFPDEAVLIATDITSNALYYMPPGELMYRWVVAGERKRDESDERADATRALREMIESGELRKAVALKASGGVSIETRLIWQPGPIAYTESTTLPKVFDEDANRCLLLGADESAEQTARIVQAQARSAAGYWIDPEPIKAKHHALQRMLRRVRVDVPFAVAIADAIPTERPEARRAMPHIISMIRAVAVLHQRQRASGPLEHGDTIKASIADYAIARRLLSAPLGRALGGALSDAVANFGKRIIKQLASDLFTSTDALMNDNVLHSKGKVNEYLRALEGAGVVECAEEGRGNKPARWKVVGEVPEGGAMWLPTLEALREGDA